jgi:hypothetical protein
MALRWHPLVSWGLRRYPEVPGGTLDYRRGTQDSGGLLWGEYPGCLGLPTDAVDYCGRQPWVPGLPTGASAGLRRCPGVHEVTKRVPI